MNQTSKIPRDLLITVDGPAGAGKTTVSRKLAEALGYRYIDTGALYRAIALAASEKGVAANDDALLDTLCANLGLEFTVTENGLRLMLDGRDVTDQIRSPRITMLASAISARPVVRGHLLTVQRNLGASRRVVFEGRDMGTVVFPNADIKFYLYADPSIRARRRYEELAAKGDAAPSFTSVEQDMAKRDQNDSTRQSAPLKPAPDAIQIDSSTLGIDGVVALMMEHIKDC